MNLDAQAIIMGLINGPGSGFTAIVVGFFLMIVLLVLIRATLRRDKAFEEGRREWRGDTLSQISSQLARLTADQGELAKQIESQPQRKRSRRSAVIDAEANK